MCSSWETFTSVSTCVFLVTIFKRDIGLFKIVQKKLQGQLKTWKLAKYTQDKIMKSLFTSSYIEKNPILIGDRALIH